jgi:adenylate cyclase
MPGDQRAVIEGPTLLFRAVRRLMRATPTGPRCKICRAPFHGVGGAALKFTGFAPSRKNPNFCNFCFEKAPHGGMDTDIGVLFADIRGYTTLSEQLPPAELRDLLSRFYKATTDVLIDTDALIDKLAGDGVMALFLPQMAGDDYVRKAVGAAEALLRAVGYGSAAGPWCPLGVGLDAGTAFVGNVGAGDVKDFTAIGDVVNTASRLQALAAAGQIIMSRRVYDEAGAGAHAERIGPLDLKGKAEPVEAYRIDLGSHATVAAGA